MPKLASRAVAVVNVDSSVKGPIFKPQASPSLMDLAVEVTKQLDDPTTEGRSYYDFWKEWVNQGSSGAETEPRASLAGSGTDSAPFIFLGGVPVLSINYGTDSKAYPGLGQYPMYHTGYESFFLVDEIIDPGFAYNRLCAQTVALLLLELSERDLVPFNVTQMTVLMRETLQALEEDGTADRLEDNGATLEFLEAAIDEFDDSIAAFQLSLASQNLSDPLTLRMVSDTLILAIQLWCLHFISSVGK
jgi:hypothetical protein